MDPLLERLAELEHRQWAHWAAHMLNNLDEENIDRWRRQIQTPYSELSEREKDSDRKWAREVRTIASRCPLPSLTILPLSDDDIETLRGAWIQWGADMQLDICIEEMSELIHAIIAARRNGVTWSYATSEEIADVLICLQQIELALRRMPMTDPGTTLWDQVQSIRAAKLDRLRGRLEEAREADDLDAEGSEA